MGEKGGGDEERLVMMFELLRLVTNCRALLDIVAKEVLDLGRFYSGLYSAVHYLECIL